MLNLHFLFSYVTHFMYLAFLLAFQFFFMLTYIFLKCNTFLFISQFFYNPFSFPLFSDILFVKNLSWQTALFHCFYPFFVQYIQKQENALIRHFPANSSVIRFLSCFSFFTVLFNSNRMHNISSKIRFNKIHGFQ